ncbi:ThiF family adenylyltransferase [Advenella sp. RU8]|uniref:ThiF family adenylyltransferase n=1 Tax=Advenella sp. RU8 TaxID=3399575 RepID=UPI003AAD7AE9
MISKDALTPFQTAIQSVHTWFETHAAGLVRKHSHKQNTWVLCSSYPPLGNTEVQLRLPPNFPAKPPRIHVSKDFFLKLPHVEHDGSICLPDTSSPNDYTDPKLAVCRIIQSFEEQWIPICSDPQRVQEEFQKECLSYWNNYCATYKKPASKLRSTTWTYLDLKPITNYVEGEVIAYVKKQPDSSTPITRQIVTLKNGDPASIANRHGWNRGTLIQGKALFVPLPKNTPWTPQVWPQDFIDLKRLISQLTSNAIDLSSWLQKTSPSKKNKRGSRASFHHSAPPFIIVLIRDSVPFCYQITPDPLQHLISKGSGFSVAPVESTRIDPSWCLTRDHAAEPFQKRQQKKVLVIGCGSLGSPIVELLARAGVGNLDIVDNESFDSPNVSRHVLGFAALEQSKAEALAARLRQNIPGVQATGYQANVADWLAQIENHKKYDLIVECSGESNVRTILSQWRPLAFSDTPVLHAWLEPFCSAAHVVLTFADNPWPASDPADEKINAADFSSFNIKVELPACGVGFHPYGAADVNQAAAFATERILATLDDQCTQATIWSWVRTKAFYDNLPVKGQIPLRKIVPLNGSRYDSIMQTRDYSSIMATS